MFESHFFLESDVLVCAHQLDYDNVHPMTMIIETRRVIIRPVSYTHLDVYKRQGPDNGRLMEKSVNRTVAHL